MSKKRTHEEFMDEISNFNPTYTVLGKYDGLTKKIECKCNVCGNIWSAKGGDLLKGTGCIICSNKRSGLVRSKTHEQFMREYNSINSPIDIIGKYINANTHIAVRCKTCGKIFEMSPKVILRGGGCKKCSSKKAAKRLKKSSECFEIELKEKYPSIILKSKYTLMSENIAFYCEDCGNTFERKAADIYYNGGCPICNVRNLPQHSPKTLEDFLEDVKKINPDIEYISGYIKASERVNVRCRVCKHCWAPIGTSLTSGSGCPVCNKSHGERKIESFLKDCRIEYEPQKKFDDLIGVGGGKLSYDFYLPDFNLLIEYQGQFHDGNVKMQPVFDLKRQQEHDRRKREYAKTHNIKLLEIWYYDKKSVESILSDYLTQHNNLYSKTPVTTTLCG